jgi:uncharacterized membrane protein
MERTFSMGFNGSTAAITIYCYLQGTGSAAQALGCDKQVASTANLVGYSNGNLSIATPFLTMRFIYLTMLGQTPNLFP